MLFLFPCRAAPILWLLGTWLHWDHWSIINYEGFSSGSNSLKLTIWLYRTGWTRAPYWCLGEKKSGALEFENMGTLESRPGSTRQLSRQSDTVLSLIKIKACHIAANYGDVTTFWHRGMNIFRISDGHTVKTVACQNVNCFLDKII